MYELIENEIHYGIFLKDNNDIERKVAIAILRNIPDGGFICEISFLGMNIGTISPYTRNRFAGNVGSHNEKIHTELILGVLASMYSSEVPTCEIKKLRSITTLNITDGIQNNTIVKDFTKDGNGTWIILKSGKQYRYTLDLSPDMTFTELSTILDLETITNP